MEIGLRTLPLGPVDGPNLFFENPAQLGKTGVDDWRIYGGHRFWTAPKNEDSYATDNESVSLEPIRLHGFRLIGHGRQALCIRRAFRMADTAAPYNLAAKKRSVSAMCSVQ